MIRTKELDEHWKGNWWCIDCQLYTGQLLFHQNHYVIFIPEAKPCIFCNQIQDKTISLVATIADKP